MSIKTPSMVANFQRSCLYTTNSKVQLLWRVNSVMDSDQIVVLDNGRVHMTGTHTELLAKSPIYRELYESQIGGSQSYGPYRYQERRSDLSP